MKSLSKSLCALLLVLCCAQTAPAWQNNSRQGPPTYRGPGHGAILPIDDLRRYAQERDQEWQRRDQEQRQREEHERQRQQWRLEEERRRTADRERDARQRDWQQRSLYEEQRRERFEYELELDRRETTGQDSQRGAYREPKYQGKPLDPKELRRYKPVKPGEIP